MVTKNYTRFSAGIQNYTDTGITANIKVKTIEGAIDGVQVTNYGIANNIIFTYTSAMFAKTGLRSFPMGKSNQVDSNSGMFFGSGTTSATNEDYKLENLIGFSDTGLSVISTNFAHIVNEDTLYVYTYTVQNKSSEPITISESALISSIYYYAQNKVVTFMWARDTFEPITLQPGEVRPFSMTIGLE